MNRTDKLKALLTLAEKHAPQDATHDGLTNCATIAAARALIENEERREKAQSDLHHYSELVLSDLNDRKTGWYYQFSAAVEKIRNHFTP